MRNLFKINKILPHIENPKTPLLFYALSFLSVIILENFLEIFSDTAQVTFRLLPYNKLVYALAGINIAISFTHTTLWWIAVALFFPLVFSYITKEETPKILRAVFAFSFIAILTPAADLILSKGKGFDIHYFSPTAPIDFFLFYKALTPGEILTCACALILSFCYCYFKTKNLFKTLEGVFLIYAGMFLSFTLPYLIKHSAAFIGTAAKNLNPLIVARLLFIIIFFELSALFYSTDKKIFKGTFKAAGAPRILSSILLLAFGIFLFSAYPLNVILENMGCFLLTSISFTLVLIFTGALRGGLLNEPRHLKISIFCLALAGLAAALVNVTTFYFLLLIAGSSVFCYLAPFQLKNIPALYNIVKSFNLLLVIILGWLFAGGEIMEFPHILIIYFIILVFNIAAKTFSRLYSAFNK